MFDLVEIRNLDGEKINVRLDPNRTSFDRLGEYFAHIRIADAPYLLVAEKSDESGDGEGRKWSIVADAPDFLPSQFYERENIGYIMQMIAPFLGEKKLAKVQEVLEE